MVYTVVEQPKLRSSKLYRLPGISGYMRIYKKSLYIEQTLRSWLPYIDECIVVYYQVLDTIGKILCELEKEYPKKLHIYYYGISIIMPNTIECSKMSMHNPRHFCYYSNFALLETTREVVINIEEDYIAIPERIKRIHEYIREYGMEDRDRWECTGSCN